MITSRKSSELFPEWQRINSVFYCCCHEEMHKTACEGMSSEILRCSLSLNCLSAHLIKTQHTESPGLYHDKLNPWKSWKVSKLCPSDPTPVQEDVSSLFSCELGAAGTPYWIKLVPRMSHSEYTLGTSFINIICPQSHPKRRSHDKNPHIHTYTCKQAF